MAKIRERKLTEYTPDPRNANKGTERGQYMVDTSVEQVGAGRSLVATADGVIAAGNKTMQALIDAGIVDVVEVETDGRTAVVVRRTDWTGIEDEQARKYAYFDNRASEVGLEWDAAQLMADLDAGLDLSAMFHEDELDALLDEIGGYNRAEPGDDPGAQVDRADELREKWQTARGQLWEIPSATVPGRAHRLMCGDSTSAEDVATLMAGERADCVFTSPPYAVGVDYGEYQDTIDNLRAMLPLLSRSWLDVVMDGGFAVVNFGDIASGRNIANTDEPCEYPMALEYWPVFRADGWLLWSRRIWCKPTPRVHSPWCIQSNRAATDFEHLWTWRKPGKPIVARIDGEFSSVNGWYQSSHLQGVAEGKEVHGAGMATGIAQWMLTTHSRRASFVFEPFVGTGTTLVACEQTERLGAGMELSPAYTAVTLQRLSDMGLVARRVDA